MRADIGPFICSCGSVVPSVSGSGCLAFRLPLLGGCCALFSTLGPEADLPIVSGPLAAHPKDEAPYGTGEDGAKEYAVRRVVAGMPVGCAFAGAVSGLDDRLGQSHIAGNE